MSRRRLIFVLVCLLLIASASVFWADVGGKLDARFKMYDADSDGVIMGEEMNALPLLRQLDLNGDGVLTKKEAAEALKKFASQRDTSAGERSTERAFKYLDRDNDGKLSRAEMANDDWFKKLDVNGDDHVLLEEALKVIGPILPKSVPTPYTQPSVTEADQASLKEQPLLLNPAEYGIGHLVADVTLLNQAGDKFALHALTMDHRALVLLLFSSHCPISNKLGPELARIESHYLQQDVGIVLINTVTAESAVDIDEFRTKYGLKAEVLNDPDGLLLSELRASTTTEVFVLDSAKTLIYRGAVNDQYGLGYSKAKASRNYLRDALDAVLNDETILVSATSAPGCALDIKSKEEHWQQTTVTYHHQIARIMQSNCVECHRQDGIAPFSLETFQDVLDHAGMIKKQVERGAMPPWFAVEQSVGRDYDSPWMNDRSLSEQDKNDLLSWLASDRPEGNVEDAPLAKSYKGTWSIGEPEAVIEIPNPIKVKAEGTMPYQFVIAETNFPDDRWVQAYEIMPTARSVVHHVIVHMHPKGKPITQKDEGGEGFWAAYVPGNANRIFPDGYARRLPAGARLSFQIHYTPNGVATEDQIKIGLKFSKQEPKYEMHVVGVSQHRFEIPSYTSDYVVTKDQYVPTDMMFTGFTPHMHMRGKAFKYEITYPDDKHEVLLDIPRYDFNWQLSYVYKQPRFIPRGSMLKLTAVFDNSFNNPANPDPSKKVRWGAQTYDEMMIGYVEHFTPLRKSEVADR